MSYQNYTAGGRLGGLFFIGQVSMLLLGVGCNLFVGWGMRGILVGISLHWRPRIL